MIEIVRAKAERAKQPWHVRVRAAGNGLKLLHGEQLGDLDAVAVELAALGRLFSPVDQASYHGNETGGVLSVWLDADDLGEKLGIPVEVVDERLTPEPEPEPEAAAEEKSKRARK